MSSSHLATVNPGTDEQIEKVAYFTSQHTEAVIGRADKAFKSYGRLPAFERAKLLANVATVLRRNKAQIAEVITVG